MPMASLARLLWGSAGLGSMRLEDGDARASSWRGLGRERGLELSTPDWVTTSMASSGRTMKRVAAGVMDDATFQESWEMPETWLGAQGCSPRVFGQGLCHLWHWEGRKDEGGGGVV
jgi:hypothetical protein